MRRDNDSLDRFVFGTARGRAFINSAGGVFGLRRRQDRRDQISKTLADACTSFDNQMPPAADRCLDGMRHGNLFWSLLVALQAGCNTALWAQNVFNGKHRS